jgi:hypothetical protein
VTANCKLAGVTLPDWVTESQGQVEDAVKLTASLVLVKT